VERYKNAKPWTGQFPLCSNEDQFFWDEEDLSEYLVGCIESGLSLEDTKVLFCSPDNGRDFEMSEYLGDSLAEDCTLEDTEINKTVNDWIESHAPFCWWADAKSPVDVESLRAMWDELNAALAKDKP